MLFTSVSYVSLLLNVDFKCSTFLCPPQNLNTLPSSSAKASMYFKFLWFLHKLYNLPLTSPFSLKPIHQHLIAPPNFTPHTTPIPLLHSHHLCLLWYQSTKTPAEQNPGHFSSISLPHTTHSASFHKYWIYQATCPHMSVSFIVILYVHIKIPYMVQIQSWESWVLMIWFPFKVRQQQFNFQSRTLSLSTTWLTTSPAVPTINLFLYFSKFLPNYFRSLCVT